MPSLARALTADERNVISALKGHNFYCYLSVTDADGSWRNVGALATGGGRKRNFFNSATLSDGIDQNTLSFGAILARNIENYSLSPFRSNSPLNTRAGGTLGVFLDIRRYWRLWACVMPIGVKPGAANYRPMAEGRIDSIDVQDEAATIVIAGRGMEADLIDSYVMVKTRTYGDDAAPVAVEDVIQKMIDDQLGAGNYPVFAPEAPVGLFMPKWTLDEGALMPSVLTSAALAAQVVRYRYDASDVNRLTQFTPPRDVTVPDWEFGHREWKSRAVKIDIQGVRNYFKATYPDAVLGTNVVISPAPEPSTVSVAGELATFSVSPGVTLADDATIVINDVGYKVSGYNAGAGTATLAGAPDVAGAKWYTSASITKYGVRPMLIDLTKKNQIADELKVGAFLDAIRSDMEDPSLESSMTVKGAWFVQLHDYCRLLPDGEITNEVTYGAVTGYAHTFANGMLDSTVSLRGKPSGGYTRWLKLGSGAPRVIEPPAILSYSADYWEEYDGTGALIRGGVGDIGSVSDRTRSVAIAVGTDETFATIEFEEFTNIVAPVTIFAHQWEGASRGQVYFFRATPWSGPLDVGGNPTGVPGEPAYARTYNDVIRPTQPQFDQLDNDVTALTEEPFVTHDVTLGLPGSRVLVDGAGTTVNRDTTGEIAIDIAGGDAVIGASKGNFRVSFIEAPWSIQDEWAEVPAALTEISPRLRRRANLKGMQKGRIVVTLGEAFPAGVKLAAAWAPTGGSFTDIVSQVALDGSADWPKVSQYFDFDPDNGDVVLTLKIVGGDGTSASKGTIASVAIEFSGTLYNPNGTDPEDTPVAVSNCPGIGTPGETLYDDEFDCGTVIDVIGERFTLDAIPAYPWTDSGVGVSYGGGTLSGGKLTVAVNSVGALYFPCGPIQDIQAADLDADWAWETDCDRDSGGGFAPLAGIRLIESATGADLHAGFCDVSGTLIAAGNSSNMGVYGATGIAALGGKIEVARISGNLRVRYDIGAGWVTLVASLAQTTPFTVKPNKIQCVVAPRRNSFGTTGTFEYFRKVAVV